MNQIDSTIKELNNQKLESDFIWLKQIIIESGRFSNLNIIELHEKPLSIDNKTPESVTEQIDLHSVYKHFNQMFKIGKYDQILIEFQNLFVQNETLKGKPIPKLLLAILTKSIIKKVHEREFFLSNHRFIL